MANTPYNAAKTIKKPHPINVEVSKQRKHGGNAKLKERVLEYHNPKTEPTVRKSSKLILYIKTRNK